MSRHLPQQAARRNRSARFMTPLAVSGFPVRTCEALCSAAVRRGVAGSLIGFPAVSMSAGLSAHADTASPWDSKSEPKNIRQALPDLAPQNRAIGAPTPKIGRAHV